MCRRTLWRRWESTRRSLRSPRRAARSHECRRIASWRGAPQWPAATAPAAARRRAAASGPARSRPGPRSLRLLLEAVDLGLLLLGLADVVEPVEHAVLAVRIDVELHHAAVGPTDLLLFQID